MGWKLYGVRPFQSNASWLPVFGVVGNKYGLCSDTGSFVECWLELFSGKTEMRHKNRMLYPRMDEQADSWWGEMRRSRWLGTEHLDFFSRTWTLNHFCSAYRHDYDGWRARRTLRG